MGGGGLEFMSGVCMVSRDDGGIHLYMFWEIEVKILQLQKMERDLRIVGVETSCEV